MSEGTIDLNRDNTRNYLKGFFGSYCLGDITRDTVKEWVLDMNRRGLAASTINAALKTLRVMLDEAVSRGILAGNPAKEVKELKVKVVERVILTVEEVRKLFPGEWERVWDNPVVYMANRIAACTGMRIGEVRGLRGNCVQSDYIHVGGQWTRHGYKGDTKTKEDRDIPITPLIRGETI
jgi:integrase